jgi:hypothetical protein
VALAKVKSPKTRIRVVFFGLFARFPQPNGTRTTLHLYKCIYGGGGAKRRQKTSADTPLLTQYHGYLHPGYLGHGYRDLRYNSVHKYKTGWNIGILLDYCQLDTHGNSISNIINTNHNATVY